MNDNKKKAVTSRDIAEACGISQTTVSYVMNNTPGAKISEKTRKLVLETARKLNYVPNSAARGMRTGQAGSVGVVVGRNMVNIGFNHVLRGVKRVMDPLGYSITLLQDHEDSEDSAPPEYIEYMRSGRIDGIIFCFCDLTRRQEEELLDNSIPYARVSDSGVWGPMGQPKEIIDGMVEESLLLCKEKNLSRICFISLRHGTKLFSRKYDLFISKAAGLYPGAEVSRRIVQGEGKNNEELAGDIKEILAKEDWDIVITPHSRLGLIAQNAIMQKSFSIPQHPKHICLDISHVMRLMYPTVTSFDVPLTGIGEECGKYILALIKGEDYTPPAFECVMIEGISTE